MTKNIIRMFMLLTIISFSSCETFDLDQTDNPSTLPPEQLDPVYVFNSVQLTLPDFVHSANGFTQRMTRQMAMTNGTTYDNSFAPVDFDNNWTTGYLMLNSIKAMEPKAIENNQNFILGAAKVIRCYILLTMVDMYGNIPYSEALQGNLNLTPKYDNSEDVYAGIYDELNQAIDYLGRDSATDGALIARDLYYGSGTNGAPSPARWATLAKTLKLKMLNNARLAGDFGGVNVASEMALLLAADDLIDNVDGSEDFAFKYGTERDVPNSRHPMYNDHYEFGTGAYIANYFFWTVSKEKGVANIDPREKYYFFKQSTLNDTNSNAASVPCTDLGKPSHYNNDEYDSFFDDEINAPYCISDDDVNALGSSYLGRDHGDASGIPQDDPIRSLVGLYPAGGSIGGPDVVNDFTSAGTAGALGEGIMPMVMASFVHFIKAEAILKLSMSGDARVELETAIRASITKVQTFIRQQPGEPTEDSTDTDDYVSFVLAKYDTSDAEGKLELIIKEYYIAAWGNGIDPYNNYRRTGYPSNFQPTIEENPGVFYSTAYYAGASVNTNPNAPSNVRTKKVFWDVATLELH